MNEAIQLAVRHDVAEFNDRKRERYVKIIGNALRDFVALRVLNQVMNKHGDWSVNLDSNIHRAFLSSEDRNWLFKWRRP